MPTDDLPEPGMPKVEYPGPGLQRWTFASADPKVQRTEFNYWRGWFGLEEEDEPYKIIQSHWLVRGQPS